MFDSRLKHAVAVGKLGSFSRAAEDVGVTQSAVTKSVADLERQLGYPLFHRTSRGALLTEEGRDFIDRASRLLADAAELVGETERSADPYKGLLRIGIFPGSLEWMLTEPLLALLRHRPSIRIEMVTGTSERGVQLLTRGDIDVAFGMHAAFANWAQFKCEKLGVLDATPFVRREHPILAMGPVTVKTLTQFDFVVPSSSEPYTTAVRQMYEDSGQPLGDRLHVMDFFPLIERLVASSDTIGFVASEFVASRRFQERFVALSGTNFFQGPTLCCAVRARWPAKPATRAMIAQVRQKLG
ncbi:LysR family transcriptional regulator [Sphingopyxis fribergensis]